MFKRPLSVPLSDWMLGPPPPVQSPSLVFRPFLLTGTLISLQSPFLLCEFMSSTSQEEESIVFVTV